MAKWSFFHFSFWENGHFTRQNDTFMRQKVEKVHQNAPFIISLGLSKLLYASTMKCQNRQILDQINLLHKNFIWNEKDPRLNIQH